MCRYGRMLNTGAHIYIAEMKPRNSIVYEIQYLLISVIYIIYIYIYEPLNLTCFRNVFFSFSFRYPSVMLPLSFRYAGEMKGF